MVRTGRAQLCRAPKAATRRRPAPQAAADDLHGLGEDLIATDAVDRAWEALMAAAAAAPNVAETCADVTRSTQARARHRPQPCPPLGSSSLLTALCSAVGCGAFCARKVAVTRAVRPLCRLQHMRQRFRYFQAEAPLERDGDEAETMSSPLLCH
jgi:hypothetical protein